MKKSKRRWGFFSFAFLFTLVLFSCKQSNDRGGGVKTPDQPKRSDIIRVKFSIKDNSLGTITATTEGQEPKSTKNDGFIDVEVGKTVAFEVSNVHDDYEMKSDGWTVATVDSTNNNKATLKVEKTKSGSVRVIAQLSQKPAPKVKVTFKIKNEHDTTGIHQGLLGVIDEEAGNATVNSGDSVSVGHTIVISANPNHHNGRHRIKEWIFDTIEGFKPEAKKDTIRLLVEKKHLEKGIHFTVEFEPGEAEKDPPPPGKHWVNCSVYLWDNLEEVNFMEGGSLSTKRGNEDWSGGGNEMALAVGDVVEYRVDPHAGKAVYKWFQLSGAIADAKDKNKAKLTVTGSHHLKVAMKDVGTSIFTVLVQNEHGKPVTEEEAGFVVNRKDDNGGLISCRTSHHYAEITEGKDAIVELMPKDPSYQLDTITITPDSVKYEKDQDNKNKFTLKAPTDDTIVTIKMKKVKTVDVTIDADGHVNADAKKTFKVSEGISWKVLKETPNIKGVGFAEGYELKEWHNENASGTAMNDADVFNANKKIFVESKVIEVKVEYEVKDWRDNPVSPDKVVIKATRDDGSTPVASGSSVPYNTKVNFVAEIKDDNWKINRWESPAQEDPTATNHTKASITPKQDVKVVLIAEEAVEVTIAGDEHVPQESKVKFKVKKGDTWQNVKNDQNIKNVKFAEGHKLDKWLNGNSASSTELKDDDKFDANKTIFVTSRANNLMKITWKIENWSDPKIGDSDYEIKATKDSTTEAVANGSNHVKDTKINLKVAFKKPGWAVSDWRIDGAKESTKDEKDIELKKASVVIGDNDVTVTISIQASIKLTIKGDHILADFKDKVVCVRKGEVFWNVRDYGVISKVKCEEGWTVIQAKFHKDSESGAEIDENQQLNEDITVFIKCKKIENQG
ncbi:MAG: hypothetical protein ACTTJ3_03765 [Treponema sp.]